MCCAEFLDLLSNCLCYMRIFYFSSWQVNRAFSPNQVLAYKHTTFLSPEVALKNKIKHNFYCNKTSNLPSLSASDSWDRFQPPSRARTGLVVKKMDWWMENKTKWLCLYRISDLVQQSLCITQIFIAPLMLHTSKRVVIRKYFAAI